MQKIASNDELEVWRNNETTKKLIRAIAAKVIDIRNEIGVGGFIVHDSTEKTLQKAIGMDAKCEALLDVLESIGIDRKRMFEPVKRQTTNDDD